MTRKDYELIATVLNSLNLRTEVPGVIWALAKEFTKTQANFDQAKFLKAAEKEKDTA